MTGRPGAGGELALADIEREFAGWECWRGPADQCYARRAGRPRRHKADVQGSGPGELRDQILRVRSEVEQHVPGWPGGPGVPRMRP